MASTLLQFHEQFGSIHRTGIVEAFGTYNPILGSPDSGPGLLHFIPVDGFGYAYNTRASFGGIAFRAIGESYTPSAGVTNPAIERLCLFGGELDTDAKLVKKRGGQYRANQVAAKMRGAGLFFMQQFFDGDSDANPKAFDGLNKRLGGNQVISAGTNGAAITCAMVDQLLDAVIGENSQKVLLMSMQQRRNLTTNAKANSATPLLDNTGQLSSYSGAKIIIIQEDQNNVQILGQDETQGSSSTCASVYCVRFGQSIDEEFLQGLIDQDGMDIQDQGQRGTTYIDLLDAGVGIALFHPRTAARLVGCLP